MPVAQITPAAYNPRKDLTPEDPEYQRLARSIERWGYVDPLIWNRRTGNLVGGHQRFKILLDRGAEAVDVKVVDLPLAEEKVLNVALNNITGNWDEPALAALLAELQQEPAVDATLTGFDEAELTARLAEVQAEEQQSRMMFLAHRVVVDCRGPKHQRQLMARLRAEGLTCRALRSYDGEQGAGSGDQ